jgi:hypothetical protein
MRKLILAGSTVLIAGLAFVVAQRFGDEPESVSYPPISDSTEGWYPFRADGTVQENSIISLASWLDGPITLDERVTMRGDALLIGDREVRLWGINNNYENTTPPPDVAEARSRFYAKYGINLVRMHKATRPLIGPSLTTFEPKALDRFDYYSEQLRQNGIYFAFSLTFKVRVGIEDLGRIPAYDEIFTVEYRKGEPIVTGDAYGLIFAAPELQDLVIEQLVNLLDHENPYASMRYADNPALAYVEIINEDNLFFYHALRRILETPTYKARFSRSFSEWLTKRYGNQDALKKAWKGALDSRESIAEGNIFPLALPDELQSDELAKLREGRKRRILDSAHFYFDTQNAFYDKATAAIRASGYSGPVVASNWKSESTIGGLWDLLSNARIGIVDRHNYHPGQQDKDWHPRAGRFANTSLLSDPGSSILSSGLEQVLNRPFMLSEWIHVFPNEWAVEGPAVIAAYGLGLQGWDASAIFAHGHRRATIAPTMHASKWDATTPDLVALYPALARQVYRGDVAEADILGTVRVSERELQSGNPDINFLPRSNHDIKSYDSDKVPREALTIGRVGIRFSSDPSASDQVDPAGFLAEGAYESTTGQLRWWPGKGSQSGYFTISSPSTKAAVGFLPDKPLDCDGVRIHGRSGFAAIYVTSLDKDRGIADADQVLITAVARARNEGMLFRSGTGLPELEDVGSEDQPILMEPVAADIVFSRPDIQEVVLLDHEGVPTRQRLDHEGATIRIDGRRDQTMYYLVRFGEASAD